MKPMNRRRLLRRLRKHGCWQDRTTNGPHEKWRCPCGRHFAALPRHQEIHAGTVRDIQNDMGCLRKGWLQ